MRLLLDTHTFLWWLADDPRLGRKARAAVSDPTNEIYVSAATAWEIAVKRATGKLDASGEIRSWITDNDFRELPIEVEHAIVLAELPRYHADPFDRMLVAQAQVDDLTFVVDDEQIDRYEVRRLDAGR